MDLIKSGKLFSDYITQNQNLSFIIKIKSVKIIFKFSALKHFKTEF